MQTNRATLHFQASLEVGGPVSMAGCFSPDRLSSTGVDLEQAKLEFNWGWPVTITILLLRMLKCGGENIVGEGINSGVIMIDHGIQEEGWGIGKNS